MVRFIKLGEACMASQRLTALTVAGEAGGVVSGLFLRWQASATEGDTTGATRRAIDGFCERLRANGHTLPVVYFCEWIDRWLMGDNVPGPQAAHGDHFQAACMSPAEAVAWAEQCGTQFPEQLWLAARLHEAALAWQPLAGPSVVVLMRQVLGDSTLDEEIRASLGSLPGWLRAVEEGA